MLPGIKLPPSVGPFSYFDARLSVTQSLFDWKSINATRAASQSLKSADYTYQDARDLVVLAVGYVYLQAIADEARIETARSASGDGAGALRSGNRPGERRHFARHRWAARQRGAADPQAAVDSGEEQLRHPEADGRAGDRLAPGQEFELTDKSPYQPFEGITVDEALKHAYASRSDYQAAIVGRPRSRILPEGRGRPAIFRRLPLTRTMAREVGISRRQRKCSTCAERLTIPIFQGGSVHGDILQADARLEQSQERLDNLRSQIDSDVRAALLNLQSSEELVNVARSNIDLAEATLAQSRDRFGAGVTDSVEVVQSQEAVASAHEQYISSLYSYNFAKISLARALGAAEEGVKEYFKGK